MGLGWVAPIWLVPTSPTLVRIVGIPPNRIREQRAGFVPALLSSGTLGSMEKAALRPREYVRVAGPDAEDFLQRMLSNDVTQAPCEALLLTPKGRIIAPLVVVRRAADDFLLLTEPGLGDAVRATLLRARFASKVEIEAEEHRSTVVLGADGGIPNRDYGVAASEHLDAKLEPTLNGDELERMRIEAV